MERIEARIADELARRSAFETLLRDHAEGAASGERVVGDGGRAFVVALGFDHAGRALRG